MDVIEVQIKFSGWLEHEAFYLNVVPSEHVAQTVVAYTELFNRLGFQPKTFGYGKDAFEALVAPHALKTELHWLRFVVTKPLSAGDDAAVVAKVLNYLLGTLDLASKVKPLEDLDNIDHVGRAKLMAGLTDLGLLS